MPLPIHFRFSQFLRKRGLESFQYDVLVHKVLRIGMYTSGRDSKLTHVICIGPEEYCPGDVRRLDTVIDFQDLRTTYNNADAYLALTKDGAFRLRVTDRRLSNAPTCYYRVWAEAPHNKKKPVGTYSGAHTTDTSTVVPLVFIPPVPLESRRPPEPRKQVAGVDVDVITAPVPLRMRPHLVPPPVSPVPVVPPQALDTHQKVRTQVPRGTTPYGSRFGQSFSLSGMVTVELDSSEHTEENFVLIESDEVEGIINRALKRAYGSQLKTLRVRITGT